MQTIYLDISNKGVYPCIYAKQSEVGRKFLAVITDGGVSYNIPENSLLSVWYEGDTDAGNYSSIEEKSAFVIDGNKVTVELVAQMLLKPGNGELCLSVTHGDGGETNTWNIPYCVEYKPGAGSSVPTEYYTALTEAGAVAAKYAGEAKQSAEFISALYIESDEHPGCYYRIVNEVVEWINPPMIPGVEYRTTERHNGKVVFRKYMEHGIVPSNGAKTLTLDFVPFYVLGWTAGNTEVYRTMPNADVLFAIDYRPSLVLTSNMQNTDEKKAYYIFKYTKD